MSERKHGKTTNKRKASFLFVVIVAVLLCLFIIACSNEGDGSNSGKTKPEITDIEVLSNSYEYDGQAHGIELSGIMTTDKVYYSSDGLDWRENRIEKIESGEYTVYYKVVRSGYADYLGVEILTITRIGITGVIAEDIVCILGNPVVPSITGIQQSDVVLYSINGGEYSEQIVVSNAGVYTVAFMLTRSGCGSLTGTFKLTVLPNISGTYIGNGERVILTATSIIIDGNEKAISYGADGRGQVNINGNLLEFSVGENKLTINGIEYIKPNESSHIVELLVNSDTYYVISENDADIEISFVETKAIFKVNDERAFDVDNYNYCDSVIGSEGLRRDYLNGSVSFMLSANSVDITLSLRSDEAIDPIEKTVLYDGASHGIEAPYDNVLYLNGELYETAPLTHTEVGEYNHVIVVLRDGLLPRVVNCKLTIFPDLSGTYVAANNEGVLEIDGLNAKINNIGVEFEHNLNGGKIDGRLFEYGKGAIKVGDTVYTKTEAKLLVFVIGDKVKAFERNNEFKFSITENGRSLSLSLTDLDTNESTDIAEVEGSVATVTLCGELLNGMPDGDDVVYYITESDMVNVPVAWIIIELAYNT